MEANRFYGVNLGFRVEGSGLRVSGAGSRHRGTVIWDPSTLMQTHHSVEDVR